MRVHGIELFLIYYVLCGVGATSPGYHSDWSREEKPNIIFILADDLGYNDVSYNGKLHGSTMKTPTIDRLAAEGVTLGNYYVQPMCTPTRSQLMTGRYQIHTGLQHGTIRRCYPYCLPLDEVTLAQKMKEAEYATHMVGKWHLGLHKKECLPTERGFETFLGLYLGAGDYYGHNRSEPIYWTTVSGYDFHEDSGGSFRTASEYEGKYSTFVLTEKAQKIIQTHHPSKPLFLYLSYQAVHIPFQVPEKYSKPFKKLQPDMDRRVLAGMISCMDEGIDNITRTLKKSGLYKNTIIIFSTDNGGPVFEAANNWPLRGSKQTLWEGGVHGVGFIHSPLLPKEVQGTTSQAFIHVSDWFPTIVSSLAGGNLAGTKPLDGYDVWDAIVKGSPSPRTELLHNIDPLWPTPRISRSDPVSLFDTSLHAALRVGDWKILTGIPGYYNDWTTPPEADITAFKPVEPEGKHIWLFNITADPYERHDLADKNPSVVKKMLHRLQEYYKTMVPPKLPISDPRCDPAKHDGVWGPW